MLNVDLSRWGESAEALREQALRATHPRSRERFMALYEISGGKSATQVGRETGRNPQTVNELIPVPTQWRIVCGLQLISNLRRKNYGSQPR